MEGHTGMSFKVGHRVSGAVLVPLGDLQRPHHPCVLLFPVDVKAQAWFSEAVN